MIFIGSCVHFRTKKICLSRAIGRKEVIMKKLMIAVILTAFVVMVFAPNTWAKEETITKKEIVTTTVKKEDVELAKQVVLPNEKKESKKLEKKPAKKLVKKPAKKVAKKSEVKKQPAVVAPAVVVSEGISDSLVFTRGGFIYVADEIVKTIEGLDASKPIYMACGEIEANGFVGNAWLQDEKASRYFGDYRFVKDGGWWAVKWPSAAIGKLRFNLAQGTGKSAKWAQIHNYRGATFYTNGPNGNGLVVSQ